MIFITNKLMYPYLKNLIQSKVIQDEMVDPKVFPEVNYSDV